MHSDSELEVVTRELRDLDGWRSISGLTPQEDARYEVLRDRRAALREQRRVGGGQARHG